MLSSIGIYINLDLVEPGKPVEQIQVIIEP